MSSSAAAAVRERLEDIADSRNIFRARRFRRLAVKAYRTRCFGAPQALSLARNIRELENLTRRLAALYPQEAITVQLVDMELNVDAPEILPNFAAGPLRGLRCQQSRASPDAASAMEHHLSELFNAHVRACRPRSLPPILREVEYPVISAALSATRGNQIKAPNFWAEPQYIAQESPRSRHQMDAFTELEHVPEKLPDFFDWNTPNSLNLSDCCSIRGFHLWERSRP